MNQKVTNVIAVVNRDFNLIQKAILNTAIKETLNSGHYNMQKNVNPIIIETYNILLKSFSREELQFFSDVLQKYIDNGEQQFFNTNFRTNQHL